jgi:hypothetical protein
MGSILQGQEGVLGMSFLDTQDLLDAKALVDELA